MRPFALLFALSAAFLSATALATWGQLQLVSNAEPPSVLACAQQTVPVVFHNPRSNAFQGDVLLRVRQAGSATTAVVGENLWKHLELLAGQTVLESVDLTFPAVNAETRFLLEWIEASRRAIGVSEVIVYPTNLLQELRSLAGSTPLGLLDPAGGIQPAFQTRGIQFDDLGNRSLESFPGKLAIVAPLPVSQQRGLGLADRVGRLAAKGAAVIWIEPPEERTGRLKPTFRLVPLGKGIVIVAQAYLFADFANNPDSQLHLIQLAELALKPEPPALPQAPGKGE